MDNNKSEKDSTNLVLVFGGDYAEIREHYSGAVVYECSMVVSLKKSSKMLEKKIELFNSEHKNTISQKELVNYCINNGLTLNNQVEYSLRKFYDLN